MKKLMIFLLAAALLLCGCQKGEEIVTGAEETTEATVPVTIPDDGHPDDVTCKGSYTNRGNADTIVTASH